MRGELDLDGLVEEIDIGGPSMVRAAAKNHASVAIVTDPARYDAVLAALDAEGAIPAGLRAALAVDAFRHTAAYDARIAEVLPERMAAEGVALPDEPGLPGAADPYPARLTVTLEKVETLRYGENPHQPAARYRRPGATAADGAFASGAPPLQGKALSYNNVLDGSAAAGMARLLRGPACVIVKHTNPCGAAERETLAAAWADALAADPVSAFGGVVALTRPVDRAMAERLASIFLEVVVAPAFEPAARAVLAAKPNLRLVVDDLLGSAAGLPAPSATGSLRTAGGAVLVTAPDTAPDDPATWTRGDEARAHRRRAARPGPGLAPGPRRDLQCDRPRPRRDAHRDRLGPDEPRRRRPPGRGQGDGHAGRGASRGRGLRLGRVLPVPGRRRGLPRGRRDRLRPAGRLPARRRRDRRRRCRRRGDAPDGGPSLPPLSARGPAPARSGRRPCYDRPTMPDRFYITTSIAYANNRPGLHTLYEVIGADALARWHRMRGIPTRFLTGTDEHSVNIAMRAAEEGRTPRDFVDEKVALFQAAEDALLISPDRFIRTTDPDHVRAAQEMVRRAYANGDIYVGTYEGWYCPNEGFRNATDVSETARARSARTIPTSRSSG